ncbi:MULTISPECIES: hypothetical protein [unclassified Streptomyces]|uniref:hypothetical protein n=1 Tax=unclassified Streptomyces TaxID=2593676 RepID=UPI002E3183B5|nr:hypothetical protein [Streptomyces sp. NBC_01268]
MTVRTRALGAGLLTAAALVALGAAPADAAPAPVPPAAPTPELAVAAPQTLDTLARFFSRDAEGGALARSASTPRIDGASVPVRILSPDFVAGKPGAAVARVEFHASTAVAADGRTASLWTVRGTGGGWRVVNIATGDDELRYTRQGLRALPGGIVFREPQIDAWYVQKGAKVLPLDEDAVRAVGRNGVSLVAYRERVVKAYGDKLPGSGYARKGAAGGYGTDAATPGVSDGGVSDGPAVTAASTAAGAGAVLVLALTGAVALRKRRGSATD